MGAQSFSALISAQSILDEISEALRRQNVEVSWYRHEGNPVALVKIQQTDRGQSPTQLRRLEVRQGWISIGGLSQEPALTSNGKHALAPAGN